MLDSLQNNQRGAHFVHRILVQIWHTSRAQPGAAISCGCVPLTALGPKASEGQSRSVEFGLNPAPLRWAGSSVLSGHICLPSQPDAAPARQPLQPSVSVSMGQTSCAGRNVIFWVRTRHSTSPIWRRGFPHSRSASIRLEDNAARLVFFLALWLQGRRRGGARHLREVENVST